MKSASSDAAMKFVDGVIVRRVKGEELRGLAPRTCFTENMGRCRDATRYSEFINYRSKSSFSKNESAKVDEFVRLGDLVVWWEYGQLPFPVD